MKTITEFSGFVLKEAVAKKAALLAEGKTEEEAQTVINEQLKLDESKVAFYKNSLDMTSSRLPTVKRVVVAVKATETEVVPTSFIEREGHFYWVEYFPQAGARGHMSQGRDDERGGRGGDRGRGGRGGGDRGRGGNDRGRGSNERGAPRGDGFASEPRAPRYPREETAAINLTGVSNPAPGGGAFAANTGKPSVHQPVKAARPARAPRERTPSAPREPRGPKGAGELRLVFKGQSNTTTLQGSGVAEAGASAASVSSETTQAAAE